MQIEAYDPRQLDFVIRLSLRALAWMKSAGMSVAMVETGGDPGHAPARSTYEKAGFGVLPIARYFRKL